SAHRDAARTRDPRDVVDASFLTQPSSDLQPGAVGRLQHRQGRRRVADAAELLEQRATLSALFHVQLELRAADRSDSAVNRIVDRVQISFARHMSVQGRFANRPYAFL